MKLYHLTRLKNVDTILEQGLIADAIGEGLEESRRRVYVTTSLDRLYAQEPNWASAIFAVIEIDYAKVVGKDLKVDWEQNYMKDKSPFSFYFEGNIEPGCLEFIGIFSCGKMENIKGKENVFKDSQFTGKYEFLNEKDK